jgi:hypothetical protein
VNPVAAQKPGSRLGLRFPVGGKFYLARDIGGLGVGQIETVRGGGAPGIQESLEKACAADFGMIIAVIEPSPYID